ncbi:MAB_1171c family putative transporter [Streptomyces sp. NPDC057743]|uniref:MAB_1171c family putative transporter n=1 Tax=Streptomyces sp. NPDC057743 TaxID=3346236 RepID=UPI0036BFC14D
MTAELIALNAELPYAAVFFLWLTLLLRARAALRCAERRGLWLAVASAAAAMTLTLPPVTGLALRATGAAHALALARNMSGVLSAVAVLYFVLAAIGSRRLRVGLSLIVASPVAAMVLLDLTASPHHAHRIPDDGPATPSLAYWLVMIAMHLTADVSCAWLCWRYGKRADNRSLKVSLYAFSIGTALAGTYWLGQLHHLLFRDPQLLPFLPILMALHGFFRGAALLAPALLTAQRNLVEVATIWRLWPLWRDLVEAVPRVVFMEPRPRTLEVLWPQVCWRLLAYRKVIETRDAILVLRDYIQPADGSPPTPTPGASHRDSDIAVLACALRDARLAKLAGRPPGHRGQRLREFDLGGLAGEKQFLLRLARAYRASASHAAGPGPLRPVAPSSKAGRMCP